MNAVDFKSFDPQVFSDPVINMNDIISNLKLRIAFDAFCIGKLLFSRLLLYTVFEQLFFRDNGKLH